MAVYTVRLASERVNYLLFGPAQIYHPVYLLFYCMAVGNQDKAYKLEIAYERRNAVLSVNKNTRYNDGYSLWWKQHRWLRYFPYWNFVKDFKLFVSWFCFVFVCFWFLEVTMKVLTILDYRMLRNHVNLQRIHCQRPGTWRPLVVGDLIASKMLAAHVALKS